MRITVSEPMQAVECNVDNGGFQPCRESLGYWWWEWNVPAGNVQHMITVRGRSRHGVPSSLVSLRATGT
jgi:hypothetical protein